MHLKYKKKVRGGIYKTYATYIKRFYFIRNIVKTTTNYIYIRIYTPLTNKIATGANLHVSMRKIYDYMFQFVKQIITIF